MNEVRIFHTKPAIIVGVPVGHDVIDGNGRMAWRVENPVVVIVSGEGVSLMPMYTLTEERVYLIPDDSLLYVVPMTPSAGLKDAYEKKYAPAPPPSPDSGFGLTTYPV